MKTQGIVADTAVPADLSLQPSRSDAPVTTTLKLSEAMRLGAMMGPQICGAYLDGKGTCALGAAAIAIGARVNMEAYTLLGKWREMNRLQEHPETGDQSSLFTIITDLNDAWGWTRELIASWVEQFER